MYFSDCASCFNEIFAATADCAFSTIWLQCIQGIIGEENPCYDCICDVVPDACLALGCGFSCWNEIIYSITEFLNKENVDIFLISFDT